jgi:hypothetical protein
MDESQIIWWKKLTMDIKSEYDIEENSVEKIFACNWTMLVLSTIKICNNFT